jgi:hypothetical protein
MRSLLALLCLAPLACGDSGGREHRRERQRGDGPDQRRQRGSADHRRRRPPASTSTSTSDATASATGTVGEIHQAWSAQQRHRRPAEVRPRRHARRRQQRLRRRRHGHGRQPEFSYIWVANSGEGTISKIDTQTLVEHGRYRVRPDSAGSPSRTSVNLSGDVAVANRNGGVTKVYADPADCKESNGSPASRPRLTTTRARVGRGGVRRLAHARSPTRPSARSPGPRAPSTSPPASTRMRSCGPPAGRAASATASTSTASTARPASSRTRSPCPTSGRTATFGAYGGAVNAEPATSGSSPTTSRAPSSASTPRPSPTRSSRCRRRHVPLRLRGRQQGPPLDRLVLPGERPLHPRDPDLGSVPGARLRPPAGRRGPHVDRRLQRSPAPGRSTRDPRRSSTRSRSRLRLGEGHQHRLLWLRLGRRHDPRARFASTPTTRASSRTTASSARTPTAT